jgi:hypothetical protein
MQNEQNNLIKIHANLLDEHRVWLGGFCNNRLKKWEDLLKANPEAAICEAAARKLLFEQEVSVEPNENLATGGPDFLCSKDGKNFYVEVTCITIEKATKATKLESEPKNSGVQWFSLAHNRILGEIISKTSQCSKRKLDAPCLLVIGTLHQRAGDAWCNDFTIGSLLTGTPKIGASLDVNSRRFEPTGPISHLDDSAYIKFSKKGNNIELPRNPVSAVMILRISSKSLWSVKGFLNPNPTHTFERNLLPNIKFGRLVDGYQNGSLKVEWI